MDAVKDEMESKDLYWPGVIIENSPVPFAIMGPGEIHRRTLIRSSHINLDLVGMDSTSFSPDKKRSRLFGKAFLSFRGHYDMIDLDTFIVRSRGHYSVRGESEPHNRRTYLSFAWRGLASYEDVKAIEDSFEQFAVDVERENDMHGATPDYFDEWKDYIDWRVAPLVTLCNEATKRRARKYQELTFAFWAAIILYAGLIAWMLGFGYFKVAI